MTSHCRSTDVETFTNLEQGHVRAEESEHPPFGRRDLAKTGVHRVAGIDVELRSADDHSAILSNR